MVWSVNAEIREGLARLYKGSPLITAPAVGDVPNKSNTDRGSARQSNGAKTKTLGR